MQINLRKAAALISVINETIQNLSFNATINLTEFNDPNIEIDAATSRFQKNITIRASLLDALFFIREKVSQTNTHGLDDLTVNKTLARISFLEKDIAFNQEYEKSSVTDSNVVVEGKMNKLRNKPAEMYGMRDTVQVSVFDQQMIDTFSANLASLKKQKRQLQDQLLELNIKNKINLSDVVVNILQDNNIL